MATICNNTTAASTPTSTPSSLVSSTCGTNCHQTQWGLHRSICSRTDSPPSCCVKPLYWTMFYQHFTMHCFYQFLLMSFIFTRILSLAHLFYAYFTHGPNKKRIRTVRQYPGSLAHPRGMYYNGKEGRKDVHVRFVSYARRSICRSVDPPGDQIAHNSQQRSKEIPVCVLACSC